MRGAQPRLRRHDPLADAVRVDADHLRALIDPGAGLGSKRREAMQIAAAVKLERAGIIHAMEIAIGDERLAHLFDLPAFDRSAEFIAEQGQPFDQLIAALDGGDFERALADRQLWNLSGDGTHIIGAIARQHPQILGVVQADALDQFGGRHAIAGAHGSKHMAGRAPADLPGFQHRDAEPAPRQLISDGQPRQTGADHADIDITIESQLRP